MTIAGKTVLVTGANRGIGQALVTEALTRGAKRVYAGTRQPLAHPDGRVTPLTLDVTDAAQIQAAADQVESLDVLINNAGIALFDDLSDRAVLEQHLAVNLFGPYGVIQAFLPLLTRSRGAIVNNVSTMAVAPLPLTPAYAISKAAAFNLTQSLRALLAGRGVRVHAVLTGPTDTDMTRGFDIPEGLPGVRRAGHLRRSGQRGGGHLPRSRVTVPGRQLAQRRGQGARARVCGVRSGRARRGISKGTDVDSAQPARRTGPGTASKKEKDAMTDHKVVSREEWQAARERAASAREGAHQDGGRAGAPAPRAALGRDREGVPVRRRRRDADPGRALRRPLPAAGLPLHVRAELRRRDARSTRRSPMPSTACCRTCTPAT